MRRRRSLVEGASERRRWALSALRRVVAHHKATQSVPQDIPPAIQDLLWLGLAPSMAVQILHHGKDSSQVQQSVVLAWRVLEQLRSTLPTAAEELRVLGGELDALFASVGVKPDRRRAMIEQAMQSLQSKPADPHQTPVTVRRSTDAPTRATAEATSGRPTADPDIALLSDILIPNAWFRVYDAERKVTRWLKLTEFRHETRHIVFRDFNLASELRLDADRFSEDLAMGRSEPIDPDAKATQALHRIKQGAPGSRRNR
jgi:hypothetical protein